MKHLRKLLSLILALVLVSAPIAVYAADDTDDVDSAFSASSLFDFESGSDLIADFLKELGLFQGTASGYELERAPSRVEAAVMLVRLLGKESEALAWEGNHAFTDVPSWADRYIAYMFENGLTKGVSEDKFGSDQLCDAKMYLTFVMRALGYDDSHGDFTYDNSINYAYEIELISKDYVSDLVLFDFIREDLVVISYNALFTELSAAETFLIDKLIDDGAISGAAAEKYSIMIRLDEVVQAGMEKSLSGDSFEYEISSSSGSSVAGYSTITSKATTKVQVANKSGDNPEMAVTIANQDSTGISEYSVYITEGYVYYNDVDGYKEKISLEDEYADWYVDYYVGDVSDAEGTLDSVASMYYMDFYEMFMMYDTVSSKTDESGVTKYTLKINTKRYSDMMNEIVSAIASSAGETDLDYSFKISKCDIEYEIDGDGYFVSMRSDIVMAISMTSEGETLAFDMEMAQGITVVNPGKPVKISFPSFEGYEEFDYDSQNDDNSK